MFTVDPEHMTNLQKEIRHVVAHAVSTVYPSYTGDAHVLAAQNRKHGDYQTSIALGLPKVLAGQVRQGGCLCVCVCVCVRVCVVS